MFVHNLNPVAFSIGSLTVYWYGIVYLLGFIGTYAYLYYQSKKKKFLLTTEQLDTLFIYIILGVVIGGRVGEFIFWQPDVLLSNPLQIFYIWQGGMAFHGGILGVALALYLFTKKYNISFYDISDRLVIPASITLAAGRIANFINAELVGTTTQQSIGVQFRGEEQGGNPVFRHPVQLYATVKNLVMAGILALEQTRKEQQAGYLTWLFVGIYGLFRLVVNFWREDSLWFFNVLSTGQVLSLIMLGIASYVLITKYWRKK